MFQQGRRRYTCFNRAGGGIHVSTGQEAAGDGMYGRQDECTGSGQRHHALATGRLDVQQYAWRRRILLHSQAGEEILRIFLCGGYSPRILLHSQAACCQWRPRI